MTPAPSPGPRAEGRAPSSIDEQVRVLAAGAVDLVTPEDLRDRLAGGRPLRVKLGIDPTASDLHLGFAVVLRKLRQFQDLGHRAVLIIGDFTARVGDPSGRSATRPRLTAEEVEDHARAYIDQVGRVLRFDDERLIEVRRNSEWLAPLDLEAVVALTSEVTVARMLERDDFARRYREGRPITLTEFLYPILQGYDSVMVEADVELGGSDQLFNNLMGRELQRAAGQAPQIVLTTPLLEGTDGVQKMSKSLGNAIGITERPALMFGKLMRIPDRLMPRYFELATGWHPDRVAETLEALGAGSLHPAEAKRLLARTVVDLYHGPGVGEAAEAEFDRVFRAHEAPSEVAEFELGPQHLVEGRVLLAKALALAGLVPSTREGRRKIAQGGVRMDGERVADPDLELAPAQLDGRLVQVGRRAWVRLRAGS